MINRNEIRRTISSKSITTATSLKYNSPGIHNQKICSIKSIQPVQQSTFFDSNIDSLTILKNVLINEQEIVNNNKRWCNELNKKIEALFEVIKNQISAVLYDQEYKIKKIVEQDYCTFLTFIQNVKNQIRIFYNTKQALHSERVTSLTNRFQIENQEYYSEKRTPYDLQNKDRQKFNVLNSFYRKNQSALAQLSVQAEKQLRLKEKLAQKTENIVFILKKYQESLGSTTSEMVENFNSYL